MAAPMRTANGICRLKSFLRNRRRGLLNGWSPVCQVHRNILSDAYRAEDIWQNRKRLDVQMDDLRVKLDQNLLTLKKPVASVELQKFLDNIINEDELNASEKYIYRLLLIEGHQCLPAESRETLISFNQTTVHVQTRGGIKDIPINIILEATVFRHTPVAHHLRPYTIHSWIRVCLDFHQPLRALKALQNKTHYGLFPDIYTFNLLLDDFVRSKDYESAYLVAKELMLIEVMDSSTPLAQTLSLYTCHKFLKENTVQERDFDEKDKSRRIFGLVNNLIFTEDEPREQEEKWYLGMTLADATRGSPSCLSRSYHMIGYCMMGNLKPICKVVDTWFAENDERIVTQEAVDHLKEALKSNDKEEMKTNLQELIQRLESSGRIEMASLDELVEKTLLPKIAELEEGDIHNYPKTLDDWHDDCIKAIKLQEEELKAMEKASKEARLEKLLQEVGGVDYWIEKAKLDGKEVRDKLIEEEIKRQ